MDCIIGNRPKHFDSGKTSLWVGLDLERSFYYNFLNIEKGLFTFSFAIQTHNATVTPSFELINWVSAEHKWHTENKRNVVEPMLSLMLK